ncbi:MAG TPA: DUF1592 domain-containing protein, partial [Planctomycetota bacterium]|nr:DUF1592 domain-containing protein [Planctomycetota bacterium]
DAAATIAEEVFGSDPVRFHRTIEAETIEGVPHATTRTGILVLGREAEASAKLELPASGLYLFRARAAGEQAGPDPARMELRMNGEAIASVDVTGDEERFATFEATVALEAGEHRAGVAYMNNWNDPNHPDPALRGDRNLLVDRFELQLLLPDDRRDGRAYAALVPGRDAGAGWRSASLERVEAFARRAFRRPLADGELDRIEELFEAQVAAGDSVEIALRTTVEAILVSPRFIFRMEDAIEPELAARHGIERPSAVAAPLDPHSVASRLSYFLWSSMPDDELLRLADSGELVGREVLESQVRRMLADPRSRALVENFGGQWLQTRFLREVSPDPELFPGVDRELLRDMETETLLFFESIVREDRSVLELLDGSYTFLNERLARHYGLSGVEGPEFRRVSLEGNPRGGILTQASFLTITSNPTRTSPVKRGLWVLERLLDMPPPPPPPDTPELSEEPEAILSGSLRQRFEKHRADPACASCHE